MALGASSGDVRGLVLKQGLILSSPGLLFGLIGSLLLARSMQSLLFQVSRFDPLTFAAMAGVLTLVALTACLIPALRATSVDPMRALRYQ